MLKRGSFSDHVFRIIFFHQSLYGLAEHPPIVSTTKEERQKFLDPEILRLSYIIMSNDSASYHWLVSHDDLRRYDIEFYKSHLIMMEEVLEVEQK